MHDTNYFHLGKSICKINKINEIVCIHKISNLHKTFVFDNNSSLYTLPIHINHYQINSVKLYIKRKLRKEIGWENGITRPPEEIFTFIKYFNNVYSDIMNKYIDGINKILKNDILNTRNDEEINKYLHPYFFINNNKFIYTFTTTEDLYSILESTNVKYFSIKDDLPEGFSARIYRLLNYDLTGMSDADIYKHYIIYGRNENRVYLYNFPENFSIDAYKNLNPDLAHFNEEELCEHYIIAGINENRLYKYYIPNNFDIDKYRSLNSDLSNLSNSELYKHFTLLGQFENRVYADNNSDSNNSDSNNSDNNINKKSDNINKSNILTNSILIQESSESIIQNSNKQDNIEGIESERSEIIRKEIISEDNKIKTNNINTISETTNNNYSIPPSSEQMVHNTTYSHRGRNNQFHIDNIINNIINTRSNMINNIINKDNPNSKVNKIPININPINIKK
jgi:hypothetical protein